MNLPTCSACSATIREYEWHYVLADGNSMHQGCYAAIKPSDRPTMNAMRAISPGKINTGPPVLVTAGGQHYTVQEVPQLDTDAPSIVTVPAGTVAEFERDDGGNIISDSHCYICEKVVDLALPYFKIRMGGVIHMDCYKKEFCTPPILTAILGNFVNVPVKPSANYKQACVDAMLKGEGDTANLIESSKRIVARRPDLFRPADAPSSATVSPGTVDPKDPDVEPAGQPFHLARRAPDDRLVRLETRVATLEVLVEKLLRAVHP